MNLPDSIVCDSGRVVNYSYDVNGSLIAKSLSKNDSLIYERVYVNEVELELVNDDINIIHHGQGFVYQHRDSYSDSLYLTGVQTKVDSFCARIITSDQTIAPSNIVKYMATERIDLLPSFTTSSSSDFKAYIVNECDTLPKYLYHYIIRDHLGNTRVIFSDIDGDGTANIVDKYDYYPFGLAFKNDQDSKSYDYKYNGKEQQKETGLYAYGARFYDPAIGRFTGVNPLADAPLNIGTSTFAYVWNNPISNIDPDGRHGEGVDGIEGDYYNSTGKYLGNDGINYNKVYITTEGNYNYMMRCTGGGGKNVQALQNSSNYVGTVSSVFVTGDNVPDKRIRSLHPAIRMEATEFIKDANNSSGGTLIRVVQGHRTIKEQNDLYNKGRTKPGSIVTNAKGGYSNHNFGLAFDIVGITKGKVDYKLNYGTLSKIGKSHGFDWGGNWRSFPDKPHFENMFGYSLKQLRALPTLNGYVKL